MSFRPFLAGVAPAAAIAMVLLLAAQGHATIAGEEEAFYEGLRWLVVLEILSSVLVLPLLALALRNSQTTAPVRQWRTWLAMVGAGLAFLLPSVFLFGARVPVFLLVSLHLLLMVGIGAVLMRSQSAWKLVLVIPAIAALALAGLAIEHHLNRVEQPVAETIVVPRPVTAPR